MKKYLIHVRIRIVLESMLSKEDACAEFSSETNYDFSKTENVDIVETEFVEVVDE